MIKVLSKWKEYNREFGGTFFSEFSALEENNSSTMDDKGIKKN